MKIQFEIELNDLPAFLSILDNAEERSRQITDNGGVDYSTQTICNDIRKQIKEHQVLERIFIL